MLTYPRKFVGADSSAAATVISLSRETWFRLAGASVESVIRTRGDFCEILNSDTTILDVEKLARLKPYYVIGYP